MTRQPALVGRDGEFVSCSSSSGRPRSVAGRWRTRMPSRLPDAAALTPQELQIARLAASGLTNKQIAERLFLSPRTVSGHLYQIFPKLRITKRAALRDALDAADGGALRHPRAP
jgi:DNA-binding NarL/FixJ family response regulator